MKKKAEKKECKMGAKVSKHLDKDIKEARSGIHEDKKLKKAIKKKKK
jgi:hypothetical protein